MTVTIDNVDYKTPESWNELSHEQAMTLFRLISSRRIELLLEQEEASAFRCVEAAKYLMQLDDNFYLDWERDVQNEMVDADPEEAHYAYVEELLQMVLPVTSFLFIEPEDEEENEPSDIPACIIRLALTRNHYPYIDLQRKQKTVRLYGPTDELENLSLYELGLAFTYFEKYLQSQRQDDALTLLALLYRPSKPATKANKRSAYQGDRRLPHLNHENTLHKRKKLLAQIPPLVQAFLLFWFASCRREIIQSFPTVFTTPDREPQRGINFGWGGILFQLSGGLAHLDQVAQQPWQNGLSYLAFVEQQQREMERSARRQPSA